MISARSILVYAKSVFASRSRILAASVGLMCIPQMSGPLWSQTWGACGSNLCTSTGANAGIGTTAPAVPLHVKASGNILRLETTSDLSVSGSNYLTLRFRWLAGIFRLWRRGLAA